ncbi:MAG: hypothetical protein E4H14_12665, partial [Candidatus Thorarchaeota archaeon]
MSSEKARETWKSRNRCYKVFGLCATETEIRWGADCAPSLDLRSAQTSYHSRYYASYRCVGVCVEITQIEFNFAFSGLGLVILLIMLATYAGVRIRKQNPALFRKYVALVVIMGVIVPTTIVVVLNIPPPTEIELDITLNFRSNSTADEATLQYHWEAPGIQKDVYGIHIDWREEYGEFSSIGAG